VLYLKRNRNEKLLDRIMAKFGGTSLADGPSLCRSADLVVKKAKQGTQVALTIPNGLLGSLHSIVVRGKRTMAMAVRNDLAIIGVKGSRLEETLGVINEMTKALNLAGINIYGVFTIASNVSLFVDLEDKEKTIRLIDETLRTDFNQGNIGRR